MDALLKTPERSQTRVRSPESRRNLFDVDNDVTSLSPTSSEIGSPTKNAASLKNLASNFNQMFLNKTPPKSAPGSLRIRRSPRLLKGVVPLSDNDDMITSKQFYGKSFNIKEGDGASILAAALSTIPKIRTRLCFDDMSASKKRSRKATHLARPLKRARTEPALNKPTAPKPSRRNNKLTINFPKKKSPQIRKEKTIKPVAQAVQAKRKARDEPDSDVPVKKTVMGTKTRYNWEIFSTENTKKFFKSLNSSITMTPPSSSKKKNLLTSQRAHIETPTNSPSRQHLQELGNTQSPSSPNIGLHRTEIVQEIQEILDDVEETPGTVEVSSLLEKLNDDEEKENECNSTAPSFATPERNKYFSVFNTTPQSSHSSTHSPLNKTNARKRTTLGIGSNQLLLDVGQSTLREVECGTCGLVYLNGVPEDEINHDKYHSSVTQMLFKGFKNERIVGKIGEDRISLVKETDPIAWKRNVNVYISMVDSELGFPTQGFPRQVYMYVKNKRVVGLLLTRHLERAYRLLTFNDDDALTDSTIICSEESYPTKCGVSRIWVAQKERQRGIASALMDSLRKNFMSHYILSLDDIAFSAPTADGTKFARKYFKRKDFLVYL